MQPDQLQNSACYKSGSIKDMVTVLFRRKWLLLSIATVITGLVSIWVLVTPGIYRANSKVLLEKEFDSEKAILFRMSLPSNHDKYDWMDAEIATFKSYPVALRVTEAVLLPALKNVDKFSEEERVQVVEQLVAHVRKQLTIAAGKNSNVMEVSYETKNPDLAVAVVQEAINTYIDYRTELYDESETFKFFEAQMKLADAKLQALEQRQAEFKQEEEVLSPEEQKDILLGRLADYEQKLTDVRAKRISKEARLDIIEKQIANGKELSIPATEVSDSPSREKHIAALKGQLLTLEVDREEKLQRYTKAYIQDLGIDRQIDAIRAKMQNEIRQIVDMEECSVRVLKAEETVLIDAIMSVNNDIKSFARKEYEYSQLSRGIDDNREIYSLLLKQREEARISLAKLENGVKVTVISPATMPSDPVKPQKAMTLLLGLCMAIVSALSITYFVDYFDHSIVSPYDLENKAGIPCLGSIQKINNPNRKKSNSNNHLLELRKIFNFERFKFSLFKKAVFERE